MDSITQIALGAAVGEAVLGKKAGNRAALWGAIAGTVPDLDVFLGKMFSPVDELLFHRSFSHSLLFALLAAPLFAWLVRKIYKQNHASMREWSLLFFLAFFTHALLDSFTTWGTQLFWPHPYRAAIKSIFVIDPLYTLPLLVCLVWLLFLPKQSALRQKLNYWGLGLSSLYLCFTVLNKSYINEIFEEEFNRQKLHVLQYDTKPAPLTNFLWTANAEVSEGYLIGYYSWFDEDKQINFHFFPKNHALLESVQQAPEVEKLIQIVEGWYTVEKSDSGLVVNDLRYGQQTGWTGKPQNFVFSYFIDESDKENIKVVPRQNSVKEARNMVNLLFKRIGGEE